MPHVLLVDDDDDVRDSLSELLELEGFVVTTASDGYEALSAVSTRRPDVIVSDIRMPPPDGIRLIEMLRSQRVFIPSILITAQTAPRGHPADALLQKPFAASALIEAIEQALKTTGGREGD